MTKARKSYPSDVSDEEWAFSAPYLTLMKEDAPQRAALVCARGLSVVDDAQRSATVACGATKQTQRWLL